MVPAVPELGLHFSELLNKMVSQGYLKKVSEKVDTSDGADPSKTRYKLGMRFFNESDKLQLVYCYFAAIGQDPDANVLKEVEAEILADQPVVDEEDEEEERVAATSKSAAATLKSAAATSSSKDVAKKAGKR
jgi:hypothetical protein